MLHLYYKIDGNPSEISRTSVSKLCMQPWPRRASCIIDDVFDDHRGISTLVYLILVEIKQMYRDDCTLLLANKVHVQRMTLLVDKVHK